jgi:hypothetical protein
MAGTTEPHLDVSEEPQTLSMQHQPEGDAIKATAKQGKDQAPPEDDGGRKSSLLWSSDD